MYGRAVSMTHVGVTVAVTSLAAAACLRCAPPTTSVRTSPKRGATVLREWPDQQLLRCVQSCVATTRRAGFGCGAPMKAAGVDVVFGR